jgi:hypothetical protein
MGGTRPPLASATLAVRLSGTSWQREVEMITPASGQVTHVGVTEAGSRSRHDGDVDESLP